MTVKFQYSNIKKNKVQAITGDGKVIAHFKQSADGFEFVPIEGIELTENGADAICEKFSAWLERRNQHKSDPEPLHDDAPIVEKMKTVVPAIAPEPDPVSGTTSAQWLAYATEHLPDDEFTQIYGDRWRKHKFREYAAAVYPAFITRANRIFKP